jgi:hypothetical protein
MDRLLRSCRQRAGRRRRSVGVGGRRRIDRRGSPCANVLAAIGDWGSIDVPGADRTDVRAECACPGALAPALSNAGLLVVALAGVLTGQQFVPDLADPGPSADETRQEMFGQLTAQVQWIWVGAFAAMTGASVIPTLALGDASMLGPRSTPSFVCYWVVPAVLLAGAALASHGLTHRMVCGRQQSRRGPPQHVRRVPRTGDRRAVLTRSAEGRTRSRRRPATYKMRERR